MRGFSEPKQKTRKMESTLNFTIKRKIEATDVEKLTFLCLFTTAVYFTSFFGATGKLISHFEM